MTKEKSEATKGETELVQMSDGTQREFAGNRNVLKSVVGDVGDLTIRMDFRNGVTRTFRIPEEMGAQFAVHGALQKYGDELAGLKDLDDMVLAVDELHARIQNLEWGAQRDTNGLAGTSVLLQAIVKVTGKPVEAIKEFLKGKTMAEKNALRASARFADAVKEIEAAKAANSKSKIDADKLLGELDAMA